MVKRNRHTLAVRHGDDQRNDQSREKQSAHDPIESAETEKDDQDESDRNRDPVHDDQEGPGVALISQIH